jgi:hypothetical protein
VVVQQIVRLCKRLSYTLAIRLAMVSLNIFSLMLERQTVIGHGNLLRESEIGVSIPVADVAL